MEAVNGLLAQRMPVTENEIRKWLDISLSGIDEKHHILHHAEKFAMRIVRGPLAPERG
jgi:hypothetical protein